MTVGARPAEARNGSGGLVECQSEPAVVDRRAVDAHGLTKQSGAWVNEAYGQSPVTIEVDIDAGIGSVDLRCDPLIKT